MTELDPEIMKVMLGSDKFYITKPGFESSSINVRVSFDETHYTLEFPNDSIRYMDVHDDDRLTVYLESDKSVEMRAPLERTKAQHPVTGLPRYQINDGKLKWPKE